MAPLLVVADGLDNAGRIGVPDAVHAVEKPLMDIAFELLARIISRHHAGIGR